MIKFDYTKEYYDDLVNKLMLNEELSKILEMRIKGYSIVQMSMKLNLSERTISRRIKQLENKIKKQI